MEIVEFYMKRNLQPNNQWKIDFNKEIFNWDFIRCTYFHEACISKSVDMVKLFLKYADELNIDLNAGTPNAHDYDQVGETVLMVVESKEVLEVLLNDDRINANERNASLQTALIDIFCSNKSYEMGFIQTILQSPKVDLTLSDYSGYTALHYACADKDPEMVEAYLKEAIKRDIDVNVRSHNGHTAASLAFVRCSCK